MDKSTRSKSVPAQNHLSLDFFMASAFIVPGMLVVKLTTASWLDIFSVATGLIGVYVALKGNSRVVDADKAIAALRHQIHRQSGSQAFADLIDPVNELMNGIRLRDWKQTSESAVSLSGRIENATQLYTALIDDDARDRMKNCSTTLYDIIDAVPLDGTNIDDHLHKELFQKCVVIHNALHSVRGKVKLKTDAEETNS